MQGHLIRALGKKKKKKKQLHFHYLNARKTTAKHLMKLEVSLHFGQAITEFFYWCYGVCEFIQKVK